MLKNNKGVTLLILMITVIILFILIGVSVQTGFDVVGDVRIGRILSNMDLVKAKVETINEEYEFYNKDTDILVGSNNGPYKMNSDYNLNGVEISEEEAEMIAGKAGVAQNDVLNWDWYEWDASVLELQGLDKAILDENKVFYINYEYSEIIYSKGTAYKGSNHFYSMTGLTNIHKK